MKARFMVENPDGIECTLKMTMTIGEWSAIRDQFNDSFSFDIPARCMSNAITSMVTAARKVYYAEETDALS